MQINLCIKGNGLLKSRKNNSDVSAYKSNPLYLGSGLLEISYFVQSHQGSTREPR